ncbi:arsenic resistance protein [Cupriavidus sp. USMAA2-4]|jgi:ACR3 family arsenite efflux pump ArsB|uniref:Arsenic resistance protein n=1 Tax=Comamonas aquatica TaxID=225991 RepID=A0AA42HUZ5_9BURK|nr:MULTISPECIES: bile acid:sodium symporter [Burkholderiales]AOY93093.1 arsenic resistance protein [Cupriavidus sp. USMAA2-4]MBY4948980.1 arsenic resistance protein [Cupriavidus respiraculi]MDH0364781.1 arsenic resistance protein [Comamonas aquatica]MRT21579.1 arsenic resistance protein [Comamonas sp. CAH-2]
MQQLRDSLESRQIAIYFATVIAAAVFAITAAPATTGWEEVVNPALALMLFVTFLQVPIADLKRSFGNGRFLGALVVANFVIVPLVVALLLTFAPDEPIVRLGILLVLLTPCIDYVVTFSHLGRADAQSLLAATPVLLIVQMLLLPAYLGLFLGNDAKGLVQMGPFVHAFAWLIAVPLLLAGLVQVWASRKAEGAKAVALLGVLPVPATALVLFVVIAAFVPQLGPAFQVALSVTPLYVAFAAVAPLVGWSVARTFRLETAQARSVAFSAGTRNSLVVLPFALSIPEAIPVLPAVIVTQTLIELLAELVYVRIMPRFGVKTLKLNRTGFGGG